MGTRELSIALLMVSLFACGKAPERAQLVAQVASVRCGDRPSCLNACENLCTGMGESGGGLGCETQKSACKNAQVDPGQWP